jgi:two-component system sensor histidine kinase RegB
LGLLALLNLFTWFRLRQSSLISHAEFLSQILADILLLTAALHVSGREASPFRDLYFVPLAIAAATLPWKHTVIVALAIVGCYQTVGSPSPNDDVVELLVGGLITYFAFSMACASRKHAHLLARVREDYLNERYSSELGTLAATAAHQMGSPLTTMAVVVGELRDGHCQPSECQHALDVMARQIEACKEISSRLLGSTGYSSVEGGGKGAADKFLATIADKCQLTQPWMVVQCQYESTEPAPEILAETSLERAILFLLGSSPASTPLRVVLSGHWDEKRLQIRICYGGPLCAVESRAHPSTPLFARTTLTPRDHQDLLMAKTTIGQFGGAIKERKHPDGRVSIEISLPLSILNV